MSKKKPVASKRAKGRPPKGAPPALPAEEVDRLLVFGEAVTCDDGTSKTIVYPSYSDLARRFNVSTTLIAKYSKDFNCMRRREQAKSRIQAQADQQLIDLRASAVALSKDDELRIIDTYLAGFEKALSEGRVRFDNPGDFNTMLRLKEFILGGADSRQEIHASLSLGDIQARHQRMIRVVHDASSEVRGDLPAPSSGLVIEAEVEEEEDASIPPRAPFEEAPGNLNEQLRGKKSDLHADEVEARPNEPPFNNHILTESPRLAANTEALQMNDSATVHLSEEALADADERGGGNGR